MTELLRQKGDTFNDDGYQLSSTTVQFDESPNNKSWASTIPLATGLYDPEYEKDSCGVGFVCNIKGVPSHKIVSDAKFLLCNMAHRGAVSTDGNGDGAGILLSISHNFFVKEYKHLLELTLPPAGQYAIGNVFFKKDRSLLKQSKATFESIAKDVGLSVLGWREVPVDSSILGSVALSREPLVLQPVIILSELAGTDSLSADEFETKYDSVLQKQLYLLRKKATTEIGLSNWFYVASLSNKVIVYKGQLTPAQVYNYYHDLTNVDFQSHFALVHSRFSTNTFPSWDRAQPLRWLAHNGEINTLRGNKNWMRAREGVMKSTLFGEELDQLYPIIEEGGSDSAAIDNVLELLVINGVLSLPEAMMVLVPEAWENDENMSSDKRAFYQWAANQMEPWDGPALFNFADGRYCGATLDRNGLRPCRYYITSDDRIICGSEIGVIPIKDDLIIEKGRLEPGNMLLVDTKIGKIVNDKQLKSSISHKYDFRSWLSKIIKLEDLSSKYESKNIALDTELVIDASISSQSDPRLLSFGYTFEQFSMLLVPMATKAEEPLGSMGDDSSLACLDENPVLIYDYFKQLFAQVTNPPIDPIREKFFMSLKCFVGPQGNLLEMNPNQCNRLLLETPILDKSEFNQFTNISKVIPSWIVTTIDITFPKSEGLDGYTLAIDRITEEAKQATLAGNQIIVLSDRAVGQDRVSLSSLVAIGAVHHHLVRHKLRSKVALFLETGEARDVHHFALLIGYGADAIFPYLVLESLVRMNHENLIRDEISDDKIVANFKKAINYGIYKIMAKMGISTLASYKGAQIFEAIGIDNSVIDICFAGTPSRIGGQGFSYLAQDAFSFHDRGYPSRKTNKPSVLPESGTIHWRDGGEKHINDPTAIASLQDAVRNKNEHAFDIYTKKELEAIRDCTLRGLLDFDYENSTPIPLDQVEPWTEIVRRFNTGAMSYGSISLEAHSTIAIAMNRMNARSNTGEGGSYSESKMPNGDSMRAAIKQVASGRFGVTSSYLANADELQVKIAQGAKAGEGGELNGSKVVPSIAKVRHSTPYVGLISPPQHHDIYSIEDLKQLLYDLKSGNPRAEVSVKLVSEIGVGIIAAGVAKAKADKILLSDGSGGTGAAKVSSSIRGTGNKWELAVAETQQTLVLNDLRGNVVLQTDGQIRTGFDVIVGILLGAEGFTLATVPLIALGCIMMRKCHLNTCPVGVATQDPELRKKFEGAPEHVVNFFYYLINDVRKIMAKLGFRTVDEMVGHSEKLKVRSDRNIKTSTIDLNPVLTPAHVIRPGVATRFEKKQDYKLHLRLDNKLIDEAEVTLDKGLPVTIEANITNTDRALGATLSYRVSKRFGPDGLPEDTISAYIKGNAGQSFGAFLAPGITFHLEGDANDYVGKGLSGGKIIIKPPKNAKFRASENVIVGNTCFYGATSGHSYISGAAGERFCVRNSGCTVVVEKIKGNNAFEYMTGGRAVVLSQLESKNAFSGCSGGIIYVLVSDYEKFSSNISQATIELSGLTDPVEIAFVRGLIEKHRQYTDSDLAEKILKNFNHYLTRFVKVLPTDYKHVLEQEAAKQKKLKESEHVLELHLNNKGPDATNGDVVANGNGKANGTGNGVVAKKSAVAVSFKSGVHEPKILDLEDSIQDSTFENKKVDKLRGFMKYKLRKENYRAPKLRIKDFKEISKAITKEDAKYQTARCMDCGVPFCQSNTGCPISNVIPKFNELVFNDQWKLALEKLSETNNFPEFTGRVCPAPCQGSCTLGIISDPVGIKSVERLIIDNAFEQGFVVPNPPAFRTDKNIAVIGSGPAGLACADQLNKAGHNVTVFERSDRPGGLLMYGIPNMKLDKKIVKRRTDLLAAEGIKFVCNTEIGDNLQDLQNEFDAVILAIGSTIPRDLRIPGRDLENIDFALTHLKNTTQSLLAEDLAELHKKFNGKKVIIIGGGDTGNDSISTVTKFGASSVINFELLPKPPLERAKDNPWPQWPRVFKVDYGHAEVIDHFGKDPREYCILSKEFIGDDEGNVKAIRTVRVEWKKSASGAWQMNEIPHSEEIFEADFVILSMGFVGPQLSEMNVEKSPRGTVPTINDSSYQVSKNLFTAGDCRRGQSLIVWGIQEGRQCAREVDLFLEHNTRLPGNGGIVKRDYKLLEEMADVIEQTA